MASAAELLSSPDYLQANPATKQAIFDKHIAADAAYVNANPATQEAIRQRFGLGAPAAPAAPAPAPAAPAPAPVASAAPVERVPASPFGGYSARIRERMENPVPMPTPKSMSELGQEWREIGTGTLRGIPGAIPGLPGDIESIFRKDDTLLPTSKGIQNYLFGPPASSLEAAGRMAGGLAAGPVAGGLSKVAAVLKMASVPRAARIAQGASTIIDPLSPVTSGAVSAVGNVLRPAAPTTATTSEMLTNATAKYKIVDDSNLAVSPAVLQSAITDIKKTLETSRYVEELDPAARGFLKVLEDRAATPQSLTQLDALRGKARDLAYDASGGEKKVLSTISRSLDEMLTRADPSHLVPKNPSAPSASPDAVREAFISARNDFGTAARSSEIETLIHRAEVSTTDNPIKALRTQFSSLARDEDRLARYPVAEQKVITDIAAGDIGSRTLKALENLLPGFSRSSMFGNVMAALAGTAGHAVGGPFGSLAFAVPGAAGKWAESARGAQAVPIANRFAEGIRAGNVGVTLPPPLPTSAIRNWLAPGAMYGTNALAPQDAP